MSTRSVIAARAVDDAWLGVYVHNDGCPEPPGVGAMLLAHWTDLAGVSALINGGDMSGLGETLDDCIFYGRDGGEIDVDAARCEGFDALLQLAQNVGAEWLYVFEPTDSAWCCMSYPKAGDSAMRLRPLVAVVAEAV